jgi:hypothetical protein
MAGIWNNNLMYMRQLLTHHDTCQTRNSKQNPVNIMIGITKERVKLVQLLDEVGKLT